MAERAEQAPAQGVHAGFAGCCEWHGGFSLIEVTHDTGLRGIAFAVTSGRPPKGMAMLVGPLALSTPISGFNGGLVVEPDLVTVKESRTLPREAAEATLALLERLGLDAWVYSGEENRLATQAAREAKALTPKNSIDP